MSSHHRGTLRRSLVSAVAVIAAIAAITIPAGVALAGPSRTHAPGGVTSVVVTGLPGSPTVTINGSGFPKKAPTKTVAPCTFTGEDYGTAGIWLADATVGWTAGYADNAPGGEDCIGLVISSWTTDQIVFTFGTGYGSPGFSMSADDVGVVDVHGYVATFKAA
jgi:hypothetical protein